MSAFLQERLPEYLAEDPFLARFVGIFQELADRQRSTIDGLHHNADPSVAPATMVRFLGGWLGLDAIDASMPEERQRRLVAVAGRTLTRRGTASGLRELLAALTGAEVRVLDTGGVFAEGGASREAPRIWVDVAATDGITDDHLRAVVAREIPVGIPFQLRVADRAVWPPGETWTGPPRPEPARRRSRRTRPLRAPEADDGADAGREGDDDG